LHFPNTLPDVHDFIAVHLLSGVGDSTVGTLPGAAEIDAQFVSLSVRSQHVVKTDTFPVVGSLIQ